MSHADRWIEAWFQAWSTHDPEALAPVYAPGRVQRSEPFRDLVEPRAYATWAFVDEEAAEVWFAKPFVATDEAGACEWWAISREKTGATVTLAGVSLVRFDAEGRVSQQRDYWSSREGEHRPPSEWGPVAHHA